MIGPIILLAALSQSSSLPPAPPRRAEPRDYAFACSLTGKDGMSRRVTGRFYDNNDALASATVTGSTPLPLPLPGASLMSDHGDFFVKSERGGLLYTWHFSFPYSLGASGGYVTVLGARRTSQVSSQTLGFVATGLCDFTTSESRMR